MRNGFGLIGRRCVAVAMALVMLVVSGPLTLAQAAMVSTDQVLEEQQTAGDRERVKDFMAREDVREQFEALGVDPDEAMNRIDGLSDAEVAQITGRLDELPAGQDAVGAIVGALLIVFLVLLITDLVGLTNVFPFVRSQR
ncbi:MAG TPA: PA2779 family protein [Kiloniellales bacterium]|nr:PA2779 family protein [Kiloniellales bacterium]